MARDSCIAHPPNTRLVVVREDFIALCSAPSASFAKSPPVTPAAILLGAIEHLTNNRREATEQTAEENRVRAEQGLRPKPADDWIYFSRERWLVECLGLVKLHDLKDAFVYLEERGFIERRRHPDYPFKAWRQLRLNDAAVNLAISLVYDLPSVSGQPIVRSYITDRAATGDRPSLQSIKRGTDTERESAPAAIGCPLTDGNADDTKSYAAEQRMLAALVEAQGGVALTPAQEERNLAALRDLLPRFPEETLWACFREQAAQPKRHVADWETVRLDIGQHIRRSQARSKPATSPPRFSDRPAARARSHLDSFSEVADAPQQRERN